MFKFGLLFDPLKFKRNGQAKVCTFGLNEAWERLLHVWRLVLYVQEALCTFRRLSARAGGLLHGKAFSLGRAEGSLHGEACSLRRTENPLHVCTSLGCQSLYVYWTHGPQIVHFDNLGSLTQKWLKMAPKSSILATWATWAAWPRNVKNGFQIVLSRLRPISHRKVGWVLAYFQIGCFLLTSR